MVTAVTPARALSRPERGCVLRRLALLTATLSPRHEGLHGSRSALRTRAVLPHEQVSGSVRTGQEGVCSSSPPVPLPPSPPLRCGSRRANASRWWCVFF